MSTYIYPIYILTIKSNLLSTLKRQQSNQKVSISDWRGGLGVKNNLFPGPCGSLQPPITPIPRNPVPSSEHQEHMWYTHRHVNKIFTHAN